MAIYQHSCQYIKSTGVSLWMRVCVRSTSWHPICGVHAAAPILRCWPEFETESARIDWRTHVSVAIWNIYCYHWTWALAADCSKFALAASFECRRKAKKNNEMKLMQTIQMTQYARVFVVETTPSSWRQMKYACGIMLCSPSIHLFLIHSRVYRVYCCCRCCCLSDWYANAIIHALHTISIFPTNQIQVNNKFHPFHIS